MRRIILAATLLILLTPALPVTGASITVNGSCSLANAIRSANDDMSRGGCTAGSTGADTITITEAGTSGGTITLGSQLRVNGSSSQDSIITIEGGNFTVSGSDSVRVFQVQQYGDLTIKNLTITDGRADDGGAILVDNGGILSLDNVTVKDSESTSATGGGGGIRSNGGSVTITNSAIYGNTATNEGGGLHMGGPASITGTAIYNNSTGNDDPGGGIYIRNVASSTNVTIDRSSIYSNTASRGGFGGGIYVLGAQLVDLKNSTLYDNSAHAGAALYVNGGTTNVTHVTIVNNKATTTNREGIRRNSGTLRLRNSIVANTTAADGTTRRVDCSGTLSELRRSLIQDGGCSPTYSGDPKLASMTTGTPPYLHAARRQPGHRQGARRVLRRRSHRPGRQQPPGHRL